MALQARLQKARDELSAAEENPVDVEGLQTIQRTLAEVMACFVLASRPIIMMGCDTL